MKTWLRVASGGLLALLGVIGIMLAHSLVLYERAGICSPGVIKAKTCITESTETVVKRPNKPIGGYQGDPVTKQYGVVVSPQNGKKSTLWVPNLPKEIQVGSRVDLLSWNGRYIAVAVNGKKFYGAQWELGSVRFALWWLLFAIPILSFFPIRGSLLGLRSNKPGTIPGVSATLHILLGVGTVLAICMAFDAITRMGFLD